MKSKYLPIALLALSLGISAHAEVQPESPKDAKNPITISQKQENKDISATSSQKAAKKPQDQIVVLMETLASSIDKTSLQIDNLQKQGADTGEAEGLIFDAKLKLHTVELNLNATTTASSTDSATSTPKDIKKWKESIRKKAIEDLKIVYMDVLNAIKSLKKTIAAQRELLNGDSDNKSDDLTAATSTDAASTSSPDTASSTDPSKDNQVSAQ